MGNNCCGKDDKKKEERQTETRRQEVRDQLKQNGHSQTQHQDQNGFREAYQKVSKGNISTGRHNIETYFSEFRQAKTKFAFFFSSLKDQSEASFDQFAMLLTTSDPIISVNQQLKEIAKQLNIVERFTMVIMGDKSTEEYSRHKLDESTVSYLLFEYLSIYSKDLKETDVQKFKDYLKEHTEGMQYVSEFVTMFEKEFPVYSNTLILYFQKKFKEGKSNYYLMNQMPESTVLKTQDWIALSLKRSEILERKPKLLYSSMRDGSSFTALESNMIGYNGPWILALTHVEHNLLEDKKEECVLGAYQNAPIQDIADYQGTPYGFLFRLSPTLRYFTVGDGMGGSNYFIFITISVEGETSKGFGFGGNKFDYKLWIDQNVDGGSYVGGLNDQTYGGGNLAFPGTTKLSVKSLQIWALGTEQNLKARDDYQYSKEQEAMRARKVDKKDLLTGGMAGMLFEQTFKHRDQVRGEIQTFTKEKSQAKVNRSGSIIDTLTAVQDKTQGNKPVPVHNVQQKQASQMNK